MPTFVDGIDIDRRYPLEQVIRWHHEGRLRAVGLRGLVVRADADGTVGFVPAAESSLFRAERGRTQVWGSDTFAEDMRQDVEREHPMVRRAALEKKAAMVRRLLSSARAYGTVPGLSDEQISTMIGEPWVTGVSVVTQQMLDRVSAHFLGVGEGLNKAADAGRITKLHPLAH